MPLRPLQVGAIVLAAGSGTRMGMPKLRLQIGEKSYLEHILDALHQENIAPVVCIIAMEQKEWARPFAQQAALVVNPRPREGMLSSIRLGVTALRDCAGLFIVPVDHPFVGAETYGSLKRAFAANPDSIVKPVWHGQSGHPLIIPQRLFEAIRLSAADTTLRQVLRQTDERPLYVKVEDAGILKNINKKSDLP